MAKHTNSLELIKLLLKSIDEKGVEKTKNILQKGLEQGYEAQDFLLSFIIKSICNNFQISESELFIGRSRKFGNRTKARAMLVYMVCKHMNYTQSQISKNFNFNKATISRDTKYMMNLSDKFKEEKKQINKMNKINNEIENFVENNL